MATRRVAVFATAYLIVIIGGLQIGTAQRTEPAQQKAKRVQELMMLFSSLNDNSLNINYFLEELNIVDEQRTKLIKVASDAQSDYARALLKMAKAVEAGAPRNDPQFAAMHREFQSKFSHGINEVLLPHQIKEMGKFFAQRQMLQMYQCETYALPRFFVEFGKFDFDEKEKTELVSKLDAILASAQKEKSTLVQESWKSVFEELPDNARTELMRLMRLASIKITVVGERPIGFEELKNMKESDFQDSEDREFRNDMLGLWNNDLLKTELDITSDQAAEMREIAVSFSEELSQAGKTTLAEKMQVVQAMEAGDKEAVRRFERQLRKAQDDARDKVCKVMIDRCLLPIQTVVLRKKSSFNRHVLESKYGDDWGATIAWVKVQEPTLENRDKILESVDGLRDEYYEKLSKIRTTYEEKMLAALPPSIKKQFVDKYGKFYDYKTEVISAWDDFRNQD